MINKPAGLDHNTCMIYLDNTSLWVSESTSLRLWDELAFAFAVLFQTVNSLFKFLKLKVLQKTKKQAEWFQIYLNQNTMESSKLHKLKNSWFDIVIDL